MATLSLYRLLASLLHPVLPLWLGRRARRGKEDTARLGERFGVTSLPRPAGKLLWFHAASMGEALSVLPLMQRIGQVYPRVRFLLTTVTVTSARLAETHLPEGAAHQFAPVDTPQAIRRFLDHWRPDMAFFVDSELWPHMLHMTRQTGCPMFLLNARMSERAARRWRYCPPLVRAMLGNFTLILAKSTEDAARFRRLGAERVEMKGNLKFSVPPLAADARITEALRTRIGDRPLWLAASTHPGEETMIASVHQALKQEFPALLTLLVPRHSRRGDAIAAELRASGVRVARRGAGEEIRSDTDIYLADTMGELGVFYRLAGIVFIGGSLAAHGGQNPFEAARLDCAILYGPHMENFTEFCAALEAARGAITVRSATELAARVEALLHDPDRRNALAHAAAGAVRNTQHVLQDVLAALDPSLKELLS